MVRLLPFIFLLSVIAVFFLSWIIVGVDPDTAPWYVLALFVILIFLAAWGFLGILLYFARTRFYRRYDPNWYFKTSFKMSFFIALFTGISAALGVLELVNVLNVGAAIGAVSLFALWAFLGKRS